MGECGYAPESEAVRRRRRLTSGQSGRLAKAMKRAFLHSCYLHLNHRVTNPFRGNFACRFSSNLTSRLFSYIGPRVNFPGPISFFCLSKPSLDFQKGELLVDSINARNNASGLEQSSLMVTVEEQKQLPDCCGRNDFPGLLAKGEAKGWAGNEYV